MGWRGTALEVREDEPFQHREWRVERTAWVAFAVILVAALLGVFSTGPLSWATERSAGLAVDYERFARHVGESSLEASILPVPGAQDVTLIVSSDYVDVNEIQAVTPQPASVVFGERGLEYVFEVESPDRPVEVEFHVKPDRIGLQRFEFAVPGGQPVQLWQLVYP